MKLYNAGEVALLRPNKSTNFQMSKYILVAINLAVLVAIALIATTERREAPTPIPPAATSTAPAEVLPLEATTSATSTPSTPAPSRPVLLTPYAAQVLRDINSERAKDGLRALVLDPRLQASAQLKLWDMEKKDYFQHGSFNQFIDSAGYPRTYSGENLARNFPNAGDVVPAFMASAAHQANVLSPNYRDIGIAYSMTNNLLVVHFGSTR